MVQTRKPKTDIPEFKMAMRAAHEEHQDANGNFAPRPRCQDNPEPFTEYRSPKAKLLEIERGRMAWRIAREAEEHLAHLIRDDEATEEQVDEAEQHFLNARTQAEAAALLCGEGTPDECPLLAICRKNAKHRAPAWGVVGDIVWVYGRQAHLLPDGDVRLEDPDEGLA